MTGALGAVPQQGDLGLWTVQPPLSADMASTHMHKLHGAETGVKAYTANSLLP